MCFWLDLGSKTHQYSSSLPRLLTGWDRPEDIWEAAIREYHWSSVGRSTEQHVGLLTLPRTPSHTIVQHFCAEGRISVTVIGTVPNTSSFSPVELGNKQHRNHFLLRKFNKQLMISFLARSIPINIFIVRLCRMKWSLFELTRRHGQDFSSRCVHIPPRCGIEELWILNEHRKRCL